MILIHVLFHTSNNVHKVTIYRMNSLFFIVRGTSKVREKEEKEVMLVKPSSLLPRYDNFA